MYIKKEAQSFSNVTASFNAPSVSLDDYKNVSIQVRFHSGINLTGSCAVQVSNDFDNWIELPNTASTTSGTGNAFFFDLQTAAAHIRVPIDISAGSCDLDIAYVLKK